MIDVLSTAQLVLRDAGFAPRSRVVERGTVVCFEDDALIGFCSVFDDPVTMLQGWRSREQSILRQFTSSFHEAGDKAWNVYCVFLSGGSGDAEQTRQVQWIEEDLERTRKIAACGLGSRDDVVRALLPVLPLQHQPQLQAEDATERLRRRITTLAPKAGSAALDLDVPPAEVIRLIGEVP
jgi:hypothetical protein